MPTRPAATARAGGGAEQLDAVPRSGATSPSIMLMVVDLPGAVRPEQCDGLARLDRQVKIAYRDEVAEASCGSR